MNDWVLWHCTVLYCILLRHLKFFQVGCGGPHRLAGYGRCRQGRRHIGGRQVFWRPGQRWRGRTCIPAGFTCDRWYLRCTCANNNRPWKLTNEILINWSNVSIDNINEATHTHTHTHTFNGPLSGTTRVSRYQKGKTNLNFTHNHASTSPLSFFTGRMSFLPSNQQCLSTEGKISMKPVTQKLPAQVDKLRF